jgi:hypothetical protein
LTRRREFRDAGRATRQNERDRAVVRELLKLAPIMRRLDACSLSVAVALLPLAGLACSGGETLNPQDSGLHEDAEPVEGGVEPHPDAGLVDASHPIDAASPSDAAPASDAHDAGGVSLVVTGEDLYVWGVTGDGYAIYSTYVGSTATFYAVSLAGGAPTTIAQTSSAYAFVTVQGNIVFAATNPDGYYVGPLTVWSSAGGPHQVSSSSFYMAGASKDSAHVVYLDNVTEPATDAGVAIVGDLYGANADGTGATLLASGVSGFYSGGQTDCYSYFTFAGSFAVLEACNAGGDGTQTVSSYQAPGWTSSQLSTGAYAVWGFDNADTQALVSSSTGLQVVQLAGGSATTIDATGQSAVFTSDGKNVVYATSTGVLARSPVASPAPQQLVASGVEGVFTLSPDDQTALLYESYDSQTGLTDLYGASASMPGTATALVSAQNAGIAGLSSYMTGSNFTVDSSHALFWSGVVVPTGNESFAVLGSLESGATTGAGSPAQLAMNSSAAFAAGGSTVVFMGNYAQVGNTQATIDIEWVDTAKSAAPITIVKGAGPTFFLTPAKDRVVYAATLPGDAGSGGDAATGVAVGLYTTPLP